MEHISESDVLNTGRHKINQFAIDPALRAESNSIVAKSDASAANQLSQETKDRLDNIVAGEMDDAEVIDARLDKFGETHSTLTERIAVSESLFKARQIQSLSVSDVLLKIKNKVSGIWIACAGDSLTYGYDINSADRRPPEGGSDDGTAHVRERAGKTYPEALQEYFDLLFEAGSVNIRNMGYSGTTTQTWYQRWSASNADLFILMLGTNDANHQTLEDYIYWMRKIILREYENGTPVVIMLPPKKRATADINLASYRRAAMTVANENNIPVFDMAKNQEAINQDFYSDNTHFNTKGYSYMASKVFAFLNGETILNPVKIGTSASLGFRNQLDGYQYLGGGGFLTGTGSYPTPAELNADVGVAAYLTSSSNGQGFYWCFETLEDNTVVCPSLFYNSSEDMDLVMELDFGIEQPAVQNGLVIEDSNLMNRVRTHWKPDSIVHINKKSLNYPVDLIANTMGGVNKSWHHISAIRSLNDDFLLIAKKGFHTIRMYRIDSSPTNANIFSLDFLNLEVVKARMEALRPKKLSFPVGEWYTGLDDITQSRIKIGDIVRELGISYQSTSYGQNQMLKVTLFNFSQNAITYYLQVGTFATGGANAGTYISEPIIQTLAGYSGTNYRSIASVDLVPNSSNILESEIVLNYQGNLRHQTYVTIEQG